MPAAIPRRFALVLTVCCAAAQACATTSNALRTSPSAAPASDVTIQDQQAEPRANYVLPALEIIGVQAGINAFGRRYLNDDGAFSVTGRSIRRNLSTKWVVDDDPYEINQAGHPYQGAVYHGSARSAGLNYWQSAAYTFAGSALWEVAGETTRPSLNDQIASGIAGSFLGEALFRMGNLLIDKAGNRPGPGRMLLVALVAPATAFNRTVFGGRFDHVMETRDPMYDVRLQIGASGAVRRGLASNLIVRRDETIVDLSIEYGLPGTAGYAYRRPFDYFTMHATLSSANGFESAMTRGLIAGRSYDRSDVVRGVWGLYGSYDYFSPQVFRISTTALSFGTNLQAWVSRNVAIQSTAIAGVGYAAAQTLPGSEDSPYHYGVAPQCLAAFRVLFGDRASLDLTAREYVVSGVGGLDGFTDDVIVRADASIGVRVYRRNAISVRYLISRRDVTAATGTSARLTRATIGLFYTLLGPQHFGAVEWRR